MMLHIAIVPVIGVSVGCLDMGGGAPCMIIVRIVIDSVLTVKGLPKPAGVFLKHTESKHANKRAGQLRVWLCP